MKTWMRIVVALLVTAGVFVALTWYDTAVMVEAQRRQQQAVDARELALAWSGGAFAIAAGILVVASLAWWSRSVVVGLVDVLVGGFFAFLPVITFNFAATINGAPPVLPAQAATFVGDVFRATGGPLGAVIPLGAGMLIAGVAVIARQVRARRLGDEDGDFDDELDDAADVQVDVDDAADATEPSDAAETGGETAPSAESTADAAEPTAEPAGEPAAPPTASDAAAPAPPA